MTVSNFSNAALKILLKNLKIENERKYKYIFDFHIYAFLHCPFSIM